ncbi:cytochrome d ubiquinol oxidase subunit II [Nakamurella antarctica]|uniref:Cytochrome d ubiquinol oxidase subunit II n=1 Tax=Nakamurella antarctica TaxID=1902245 RepID=A0A3G8ZHL4_9ACTN|nr:cytochrome d ubiquinol oxidase subunit II [Nakamurella antarctica]AZI56872.1 cytochrome d ubiquinol oxidase subunit II [Nakamurella antarctica]
MELSLVWFILIAVLWIGYFILEGFDFGVGALLRIVGRDERGRRVLINTIGPLWDGNEVWVITAIGATFAAFPDWYATMLSGMFGPMLAILLCLIVRGVAFEYRAKGDTDKWRANWDLAIQVCSWGPAFLWGVLFGNMIYGMPLDEAGEYTGGFFGLFGPFPLLLGLLTLGLFLTHGAIFLALKTRHEVRDRAKAFAERAGVGTAVILVAAAGWLQLERGNIVTALVSVLALGALVAGVVATKAHRDGWAFVATAGAILSVVVSWFAAMYPNLIASTTNAAWSLTVQNASSSPYTLKLMTWVAVVMLPFILAYQAWSYWVFRKRISAQQIPLPQLAAKVQG